MVVFPLKRIVVLSPKSVEACALLLIRAIPPPEMRDGKPVNEVVLYYGSVWEDSFLIQRNLNYRNTAYPLIIYRDPFNPVFYGKLTACDTGTQIKINASFHPVVVTVSIFFYLILFTLVFGSIGNSVASHTRIEIDELFLPGVLITLMFAWQAISLLWESRDLESFLSKTVLARKGNPDEAKG